jgi:hypothetical protein
MCGDFNEALFQAEHYSARRRSERQMADFRETLDFCNLHDMGYFGTPWTFNNKQQGVKNVRVRLDRGVACPAWSALFPEASVQHLISSRSDHYPILINLDATKKSRPKKPSPRYEAMWEREASLNEHIEAAWNHLSPAMNLGDVQQKLTSTMAALQIWNKEAFGSVNKEIKLLKGKLGALQNRNFRGNQEEIKKVSARLDELLHREEIVWRQRSRIEWLREGDQNTIIFHRKASSRAKKNKMVRLKRWDGTFATDENEIIAMSHLFFDELYTEDPEVDPRSLLEFIEPVISDQINQQLLAEFSDDEIGDALFQIAPLKAPGPDGLPARFFQRNWALLRAETCRAVKQFFSDGILPDGINMTKIVLIPKSNEACELKDYRPISLCNVVYKVISKCLVNRIRPHLHGLISETQSAFIPGRLISDNALIAFECFHAIQRNKKPDNSFCAYKMDLSKAYDRVDWRFLEGLLLKWGFDTRWVKWIMCCVTTVKFCIQVNDSITEEITPTRGLRQGDPLSPYLFLFVADSFSKLIQKAVYNQELSDLKICRMSPGISHLLFADDCIMFFKAKGNQARTIKSAIATFERGSGQLLSPNKCSIMFGESCHSP